MQSIFQSCKPRADVENGTTKDEQFAADLAQVVNNTAPREYADAATFFRHSFPTRGMKDLLRAVCTRLSGKGGEIASIIRLDTQFGGGKTHGLIALTHAVRGMQGVENVAEFINPELLPRDEVRVAALDGENADPADGLTLEGNLRAYSLWGELAYRLAGVEGYRRVENADRHHTAPGAETIRELFGGKPTLIMLDEVSVYLRKVEEIHPGASQQFTAFIQALFKAVESSPRVSLVMTLAIGKDSQARDAYKAEHERALQSLAEAESVVSRKATQLNPTEEDETSEVLRRRLFERVDTTAAAAVVAEYSKVWLQNQASLPPAAASVETRELFRRGYPLHPETLSLLTVKLASLNNFHRTRGMLRLLARTVHKLWKDRPADAQAIHPHHIDLGFSPIRDEVTTRLGQGDFTPAIKADVAAVPGDDPATSQVIDNRYYPGQLPITAYIARTVFLNTLAYGDSARGITPDQLKFSVCSPKIEPSFIEQSRLRFLQEALFLDDRPGAPMRFMVEPNVEAMIRRIMRDEIDNAEVRTQLQERIRELFNASRGPFELVPFPTGSWEVDDTVGDGRPRLVVLHYEAAAISDEPRSLPPMIDDILRHKGADQRLRELQNNLVFVIADQRAIPNMQDRISRALALRQLQRPERIRQLAPWQQERVKEEDKRSRLYIAEAILQCYRHLFFPSVQPMPGCELPVAHAVIEVHNASSDPGNGQVHVTRVLRDHQKILGEGDKPEAPAYVRDQTPLRQRGEITTLELRNEYRRAPKLSILLNDSPLQACIREGLNADLFIYRQGDQVWGKGDPSPVIQISDNAFVHTVADARKKQLWPRPEPMVIEFKASPRQLELGSQTELTVAISGGISPYTFSGSDPGLQATNTSQTVLRCTVAPASTETYQVEVRDSRGQRQTASANVTVVDTGRLALRLTASPSQLTLGQQTTLNLAIHGGKPPFKITSVVPQWSAESTTETMFQSLQSPTENTSWSVDVADATGTTMSATTAVTVLIPKRPELAAEGPLSQALIGIWEKARAAKVRQIEKLIIRLYDATATWKLHHALSTAKDMQVTCELETTLVDDGIESFKIAFCGLLAKANPIKSFLEPQLRSAADHEFTGIYTIQFNTPFSTAPEYTDVFTKNLTRYGNGEAYVEAHAAPVEANP
jgi:hypothetical protein